MKIPYRRETEYTPVAIDRLRPTGSYAQLIANRTHAIAALVAEHGVVPAELLRARNCPTCRSDRHQHELDKDHLALVRCLACDLVYVNPAFDEEHYREIYQSTEYQAIMKDLGIESHDYRVERFGRERVEIMAAHLPQNRPIRYLDVGCSTGFVVEAARQVGWDALGIDLNPSAIEFGKERGLDLRAVTLDGAGFDLETFDAVSLFDVVEHLLEPSTVVASAVKLLRPGGILFIYVPNYDSASRLLLGADAHFIWPTHHLNYYTPETASDLLSRHGLEVELLTTEGLDIVDYGWSRREVAGEDVTAIERIADTLQFLVNAGAYGKNLRVLARRPL